MWFFSLVLEYGAPFFLITAPFTSYADQIYSIHRTKTSAGFSLDIPLIMLVASILKVFYWFGEYYSYSLFFQAVNMVAVQLVLLKVALDNRPSSGGKESVEHTPFSGQQDSGFNIPRPYNFWRWKSTKPYWNFIAYFSMGLFIVHVFLPFISHTQSYIAFLGLVGLTIEAFLPLPQVLKNQRSRSCQGFRLSVLTSWLLGDVMKMSYLFYTVDPIPIAFKMCAVFQAACDCYLGLQYWIFEQSGKNEGGINTRPWRSEEKDIRMNAL